MSIQSAKGMLVNVSGGDDLTIEEVCLYCMLYNPLYRWYSSTGLDHVLT